MGRLSFFLDRVQFGRRIDVHVRDGIGGMRGDRYARMLPAVFEEIPEGGDTTESPPAFSLRPEDAQQLIDELWTVGFRPTQGQQSEGATGMQGAHLQDMRKLVSHLMQTELPGTAPKG